MSFYKVNAFLYFPNYQMEVCVKRNLDLQIVTPGAETDEMSLKGYCVNPKFFPSTIRLKDRAKASLVDRSSGNIMKGEFIVTDIFQSRWESVTKALGQIFEGKFYVENLQDNWDVQL